MVPNPMDATDASPSAIVPPQDKGAEIPVVPEQDSDSDDIGDPWADGPRGELFTRRLIEAFAQAKRDAIERHSK